MFALDVGEVEVHLRVVAFRDIDLGLEVSLLVEMLCALEVLVSVGVCYLF